jgi:hypothetical protein
MSQQIYDVNKEFEISLNLKVKISSISNHYTLSEQDIENAVEDIKINLKETLLRKILKEDAYNYNLTEMVDIIIYSIKENEI